MIFGVCILNELMVGVLGLVMFEEEVFEVILLKVMVV